MDIQVRIARRDDNDDGSGRWYSVFYACSLYVNNRFVVRGALGASPSSALYAAVRKAPQLGLGGGYLPHSVDLSPLYSDHGCGAVAFSLSGYQGGHHG